MMKDASLDAPGGFAEFLALPVDLALEEQLHLVAQDSRRDFPKLALDNFALSVIDLTRPARMTRADYQGDDSFYPASLVKLFFMFATFAQGQMTPETDRALSEMIRVSDNDAASYLVDLLTGTTSGPELAGPELEDFLARRKTLNRYFISLGYDVSVMLKPWSFGPFGRDQQIMGENRSRRNRVSANAVAALLFSIVQRRAISVPASEAMLRLLERPLAPPRPMENQVKSFFGESLPPGARLWSKEGDTSEVRHDAAYVELRDGGRYIVVILSRGAADEQKLLPSIGRHLLQRMA